MCWQIMQLGQDALCGVQFGVLRADAIWPSGYYGLVLVLLGFLPLGSLRILFFYCCGIAY